MPPSSKASNEREAACSKTASRSKSRRSQIKTKPCSREQNPSPLFHFEGNFAATDVPISRNRLPAQNIVARR
jgi:hypothetical protein